MMEQREKLIDILSIPIHPRIGADYTEVVADYLLDNDVLPVVRCKDCSNAVNTGDKWLHCLINRDVNGECMAVSEFGFCSYGQKKISND